MCCILCYSFLSLCCHDFLGFGYQIEIQYNNDHRQNAVRKISGWFKKIHSPQKTNIIIFQISTHYPFILHPNTECQS